MSSFRSYILIFRSNNSRLFWWVEFFNMGIITNN